MYQVVSISQSADDATNQGITVIKEQVLPGKDEKWQ